MKQLYILGTRGVPAAHGGFETFAEHLALFLVARGWDVSVYCQEDNASFQDIREESWRGVRRIIVPVGGSGPLATLLFDWRCVRHAARRPGDLLVLGYNSALFNLIFLFFGKFFFINMDGIEWQRPKWSLPIKAWFWLNEQIAGRSSPHLIADHPAIERYLRARYPKARITMIAYGGRHVTEACAASLDRFGLTPGTYYLSVCRIEPDNSMLELVQAFSAERRKTKLCVVGGFQPDTNAYHRKIRDAASEDVIFPGAIYEQEAITSLRFHLRAYCHGHQHGGTNPSLVEALGAGNAVIAHDNAFNRWTAGADQFYFDSVTGLKAIFDRLDQDDEALANARKASEARFKEDFDWDNILSQYETLLSTSRSRFRGAETADHRLLPSPTDEPQLNQLVAGESDQN